MRDVGNYPVEAILTFLYLVFIFGYNGLTVIDLSLRCLSVPFFGISFHPHVRFVFSSVRF